jgi:hypothetical protein
MRRLLWIPSLLVLVSACLAPVVEMDPQVLACVGGGCPLQACEECESDPAGPAGSPEDALAAHACDRLRETVPDCEAYRGYSIRQLTLSCPKHGTYCIEVLEDGLARAAVVSCFDGGQAIQHCASNEQCSQAGECVLRKRYDAKGDHFDAGPRG